MDETFEHEGMRFQRTGEHRCPRKGEWFATETGTPVRAEKDFIMARYPILRELGPEPGHLITENRLRAWHKILTDPNFPPASRCDVVSGAIAKLLPEPAPTLEDWLQTCPPPPPEALIAVLRELGVDLTQPVPNTEETL